MFLIVEQIVEIDRAATAVKKVCLGKLLVDLPPVMVGDDLWFINEGGKRTRLIVLHSRMAISEKSEEVHVILDTITPELYGPHQRLGFGPQSYREKYLKDAEGTAPNEVFLSQGS